MGHFSQYHAELSEEEITNDLPAARAHYQALSDHLCENMETPGYYRQLLRALDLLDVAKMKAGLS